MAVQFAPFNSSIHPGFWTKLSKLKLEVWGLDQKAVQIVGTYENKAQAGLEKARLNVDWDAFEESDDTNLSWQTYEASGSVINYNTMEAFKTFDKAGYLNETEKDFLYDAITNGQVLEDTRILSRFAVHMFADLKKYHYFYWFTFPAFVLPDSVQLLEPASKISEELANVLAGKYSAWKSKVGSKQCAFFWITSDKNDVITLKEGLESSDDAMLGFADPCNMPDHPGWPMRNLLAFIGLIKPSKLKTGFTVVSLRQSVQPRGKISMASSLVFKVKWTPKSEEEVFIDNANAKLVGWEKNDKNQFGPRLANIRSSMDPKNLAESSVDLNLKLMKWRLVPELDLDLIAKTKVLLLGSGTLGCNVARCLLGWGVRNITFVDNGKVSYSNPVRQSLFDFEDCLDGGKAKAETAAENLKQVFPGVNSAGHTLTIPMPGHPISDSLKDTVKKDYDHLESLIKSHDVIFLLMDTRESRWLPTLMGAAFGKLVMNAALGFDSFLVMRHGIRNDESWTKKDLSSSSNLIPGNRLGCYFCNDVVAPGNSTKDRTLDQQCTVTRPGVSYQAAAMAVELMTTVIQHPEGANAPASISREADEKSEGILGRTSHSIRGSLSSLEFTFPTTERFSQCTACSKLVLDEFARSGFDLLMKTASNNKFLEDLTGLSELMAAANLDDVIACSDSDLDSFEID